MQPTETNAGVNPFQVFRSIVEQAGGQTVFGPSISAGDRTILPAARVRYGFGGGAVGKEYGGGGGGGLIAKPVGVFEISQSGTRFIPVTSNRAVLVAVLLGVSLGFFTVRRSRR